jgi:hypothetical protein
MEVENATRPVETVRQPVPFFNKEPVVISAAIRAILACAIGFGLELSTEQMGLVILAVESVLMLITRSQTTPFVSAGTTPNVESEDAPYVG